MFASSLGKGYVTMAAAKANRADSNDVEIGDALQWDMSENDGISVKQPVTSGLLGEFAGIAARKLPHGDQNSSTLVVSGVVACKFENHASAAAGEWATPVNGEDYLTYSETATGIRLLTKQDVGTDEHTPDEGAKAPLVWLMPAENMAREAWLEALAT